MEVLGCMLFLCVWRHRPGKDGKGKGEKDPKMPTSGPADSQRQLGRCSGAEDFNPSLYRRHIYIYMSICIHI